jgi:Domain of unknown function DUF11
MSDIKDQHEINELRKRLYARGPDTPIIERHALNDRPVDIARNWGSAPAVQASVPVAVPVDVARDEYEDTAPEKPRRYRKIILIGSVVLLALVCAATAAYLFFGGNRISGENIAFNIAGSSTVSGGETMSFQIGVTNQNTIAIEGATLIVKYPAGTRSVTEPIKNMYEERIEVGTLLPGEAKNISLQVAVYGKENQQLEIKSTLEYRLVGSDGTFYKEAEPLRFQIISSPILLQVTSVRKVAAGQTVEMKLTAKSNTNKSLKDVLITATYPGGFTYKDANPDPIYNQNVWKIDELKPEETETITITGVINGLTSEGLVVDFSAGAAETDNPFIVGSLLADARAEFVLEQPFIAVDIEIAGDKDRNVVLEQGKSSNVLLTIKNTLDETVYDMVVEVVPSGNALSAESITSRQGFYDSNKGLVRFDISNTEGFSQVLPGESQRLDLSITPQQSQNTTSFNIAVNVYAKRVADASAQQQLVGTVSAEARYASEALVAAKALYKSGPLPPKVGQTTAYQITLSATAGSNNLTNSILTTTLPGYIEWTNEYSAEGVVEYNAVSRQIYWNIGDITGGTSKNLVFTANFLPSLSQVGINPLLINSQSLTATDRFTNTPVKATTEGITTELGEESGYEEGNGTVEGQ